MEWPAYRRCKGVGVCQVALAVRERLSYANSSCSTANKESAFLLLGDHFILGDKLPLFSKHHCEGITCLKEIVSNTRLDLQTDSDYFKI